MSEFTPHFAQGDPTNIATMVNGYLDRIENPVLGQTFSIERPARFLFWNTPLMKEDFSVKYEDKWKQDERGRIVEGTDAKLDTITIKDEGLEIKLQDKIAGAGFQDGFFEGVSISYPRSIWMNGINEVELFGDPATNKYTSLSVLQAPLNGVSYGPDDYSPQVSITHQEIEVGPNGLFGDKVLDLTNFNNAFDLLR